MVTRLVGVALGLLVVATACSPLGGQSAPTPSPPVSAGSPSATPPGPTPSAPATAAPTSPPATPAPTPACAAGFAAADASGGSPSGGRVVTARVGSHDGYDRFVVQFDGAVPGFRVTRQGPGFELSPSGQPVTLDGSAGVLVRLEPALDWTAYAGPSQLRPGYPALREARLIENFEAVQQWGLGVSGPACLRVFTLASPSRLVVDISAAS